MNNVMTKSIVCASLMMFSQIIFAGEQVDKKMEAGKGDVIEIEHLNGFAKIEGWDKNLVHITGELDDEAEGLTFERTSNGIEIEVEMPRRFRTPWGHEKPKGDNLVIKVPRNSRVNYTSMNASVEVGNIDMSVSVDTVNGSVAANELQGKINIETVNGHIKTRKLNGAIRVGSVNGNFDDKKSVAEKLVFETVNGDIKSDIKSLDTRIETVNGKVELSLGDIKRLEVSTVNGEIDAQFTLLENAEVEASSVGGKITLTMQKEVPAYFEVNTYAGGKIINDITNDKPVKSRFGPGRSLEFSTPDASAKVEVESVNGKIHLTTH
ncbi:DUF4097 family beta strand repeat-containing protein [Alteromonas sp. a30]|uniref:DUF4097 family beta strand repeat-containing protein n=1 Tax=Alteromonas sp. a30 TaxID=2730917 RepID=UPI002282F02D|nr:DUF4097 family beta strand repeat-containing protein [Alteromonas sp. a30]MCY7296533.1 DUF4097 family beta strand repeat protein [Alteromonas sp. a30]